MDALQSDPKPLSGKSTYKQVSRRAMQTTIDNL